MWFRGSSTPIILWEDVLGDGHEAKLNVWLVKSTRVTWFGSGCSGTCRPPLPMVQTSSVSTLSSFPSRVYLLVDLPSISHAMQAEFMLLPSSTSLQGSPPSCLSMVPIVVVSSVHSWSSEPQQERQGSHFPNVAPHCPMSVACCFSTYV